ncbi:BglG family transcription antiterminator [Exiguobacterium alkaliphilum]|uniref:PTS sugar transporter subunit IIA n=1 Tax=Exiguobacterium alkaliphilum TaxID=1428684 RepID=A0ABT2L047_9BACL|nr:PTS sugar transporter subunit IIA [Exiguobacterium alkaliphilum]MCT4796533.1 PTS sugar transporter subunit IIA [Exiguobacterium alkaliphilum]
MKHEWSARERSILLHLLGTETSTPLAEIAQAVNLSERTIQRERQLLEGILREFELELSWQRGRGLSLVGATAAKQQLREDLILSAEAIPTAEDRIFELAWRLLFEKDMLKLQAVAKQMHVSPSTLTQDLEKLDRWFDEYHLEVERKKGVGAQVLGLEAEKRKLMINALMAHWDTLAFYRFVRGEDEYIPAFLKTVSCDAMLEALRDGYDYLKSHAFERMDDRTIMRVTFAYGVQQARLDAGFFLEMYTKGRSDDYLKVARDMEVALGTTFSMAERVWLAEEANRLRSLKEQMQEDEEERWVMQIRVHKLIHHVSLIHGFAFTDDAALEKGLLAHILSSLNTQALPDTDTVRPHIDRDYPNLRAAIQQAADIVFGTNTFTEEETVFWAMHFAAALVKPVRRREYRALVVCSAGLGSSKMLVNRVKQEFPEMQNVVNSSLFGLEQHRLDDYDVILSTVPLPPLSVPTLMVNPLLTTEEVQRVRHLLLSLPQSFQTKDVKPHSTMLDFQELAELVDTFERMDRQFDLVTLDNSDRLEDILFDIGTQLEERGLVESGIQLSAQLLRRHEVAGLGIPGTKLALFHGRHASIERASVFAFDLTTSIPLLMMDQSTEPVSRLLVLLAPEEARDVELQFLSAVSGSLIESEEQMTLYSTGSKKELRLLLHDCMKHMMQDALHEK